MNLNERISKIINHTGLSSSEFADEIDVPRSSISHITSGRNKPSLDFLIKVKDKYEDIRWDWLIKGQGEMFENKVESEESVETKSKKKPASLPDLFSLIDDANFGITESEDTIVSEAASNRSILDQDSVQKKIDDSQRLAENNDYATTQNIDNQSNKIKRVVLFFENGKFESYEL